MTTPADGRAVDRAHLAACGFAATLISIGSLVVPPPETEDILNYEANIIAQSLLLFIVGFVLYAVARRQ